MLAWARRAVGRALGDGRPDAAADRQTADAIPSELRQLLEAACDVAVLMEPDSRIVAIIATDPGPIGHDFEALVGTNGLDWVHPSDAEEVSVALAHVHVGRRTLAMRLGSRKRGWDWFDAMLVRPRSSDRVWALSTRRRAKQTLASRSDGSRQLDQVAWRARRIAHQMNNLLHIARGVGESPAAGQEPSAETRTLFEEIGDSAERGALLARQLLEFAQGLPTELRGVDIRRELSRTRDALESIVGAPVSLVEPERDEEPLLAKIDPGAFELALASLLVNLSQRVGEKAQLCVRALPCDDGASVAIQVEAAPVLSAAAPPSDPARRFDPLSTLSDEYVQEGYAIAFVIGVLEPYDGRIDVEVTPDSARCYRIVLPRSLPAPAAAPRQASRPRTPASDPSKETILVVDDSPEVRGLAARILSAQGYQVLEAASGWEASQLAEGSETAIDLLLADLILGDESGLEVRNRLAEASPRMRSLFMSGFPDVLGSPTSIEADPPRILAKPFRSEELVGAVREALARRPPEDA